MAPGQGAQNRDHGVRASSAAGRTSTDSFRGTRGGDQGELRGDTISQAIDILHQACTITDFGQPGTCYGTLGLAGYAFAPGTLSNSRVAGCDDSCPSLPGKRTPSASFCSILTWLTLRHT